MPIYTLVDGEEVRAQGLRYSNTDPGGFDAASFTTERVPEPGAPVRILDGLGELFGGHVEEPGRRQERGRESANVQAVGHADLLKRNPYPMIYLDRSLDPWGQGMPAPRRLALASTYRVTDPAVERDATTGAPGVRLGPIQLNGGAKPLGEAWYDAGSENAIGKVRYSWAATGAGVASSDANWQSFMVSSTEDNGSTGSQASTNLLATVTSGSDEFAPTNSPRYLHVYFLYDATTVASANVDRFMQLSNLRIIGTHGLPIVGGDDATEGIYPSDVVAHALMMSQAGFDARITLNPNVIPHLTYRELTAPLTVIGDIGKLTAWHWGVWEPVSCLSDTPTLLYQPPPPRATAAVRYADCIAPEIVEKLSDLHDEIILRWADPAGAGGVERLTSPHPRPRRTTRGLPLQIDGGVLATEAVADALAATYLFIDQAQSRASGQATLPAYLLDGRPAHHLKSGRDRLELVGLPASASLITDPPARPGAFRVKRVEVDVDDASGVPRTQVQFDAGADLIEALNARLGIASVLAGA